MAKARRRTPTKRAGAAKALRAAPKGGDVRAEAIVFSERLRGLLTGTYDAATNTDRTASIWATATGRSQDSEATPAVRARLRNRVRFEVRNNPYLRGMLQTKSADIVGRVPRLQLLTLDEDYNEAKEAVFNEWAEEIRLGEKLRTLFFTRMESGEGFLKLILNPLLRSPIHLDVEVVECDRVTSWYGRQADPHFWDGVTYDDSGNEIFFDVLRFHPGGPFYPMGGTPLLYDTIPASQVIHFYRKQRPEQRRGIPDAAASLNLCTLLRRFTMAVVAAAEASADVAWAMKATGTNIEPAEVAPGDKFALDVGSGVTLPVGWDLSQLKPEHPCSTYREFKEACLIEIGRGMDIPANIALGDSSKYNFASGRLDHQGYHRSIGIERYDAELCVLDRVLRAWDMEYRFLPESLARPEDPESMKPDRHEWFWDGFPPIDPREADAESKRLASGQDTLADHYGRLGSDWRAKIKQIGIEQALVKKLGIHLDIGEKTPAPVDVGGPDKKNPDGEAPAGPHKGDE